MEILKHNQVNETDKIKILDYAKKQRQLYNDILLNRHILDEIPVMSETEFNEQPMLLPLSEIFYEKDIFYTYEEYQRHIFEKNWVIISKNKAPAIHFVIYNPQLRNALENMEIPFLDKDETL